MMQARAKFVEWAQGRRRGVAITGASGWIGRALAHAAAEAEAPLALRLFASRQGTAEVAGRALPLEPLAGAPPLDPGVEWLVLHLAVAGGADEAELRAANDRLLEGALRLMDGAPVRRFVYASSGAARAAPPGRQAYAAMKRAQEAAAQAWAETSGVPLLTPRIFNVGGPYITHPDSYALGSFVRQALDGGTIRIGAARPVVRSYLHVLDLAEAVLGLALDARPSLAFDAAGGEPLELGDLALAVGEALGRPVRVERPPITEPDEDRYLGDGALLRQALGREPASLARIVRDTAAGLAG